ncbi:AMP-binding protein [Streptomyces coerulescens]|uniref:AMP-binding protein n=1 Tax=Streptomyces coerulescens TaxID=29304 RepID=A0ABW0CJ65_STRCD
MTSQTVGGPSPVPEVPALSTGHTAFRAARDLLLRHAQDPRRARAEFAWPRFEHFNWAVDWFDVIAAENRATALRVLTPEGDQEADFATLSARSDQVAGWLAELGVRRGDAVLLLLDNGVEVWEVLLALMKLRAVAVPVFTTLDPDEVQERLRRSRARHLVASASAAGPVGGAEVPGVRVVTGGELPGWEPYERSRMHSGGCPAPGPTPADEVMSCFFTSGSTARPKLVAHTHRSYPVGHLTGMFWAGFRPGDVHLNVSSPGWAKHPWSSFFAPWNAEATIVSVDTRHADPEFLLDALERTRATTFCAPPSIWRALVRAGLTGRDIVLREAMSVGEPLTQDIVTAVRDAWGVSVRNGYGQSEVTAMTGVLPVGTDDPRSLGRPLPGCEIVLCPVGTETPGEEGEVCLDLTAGAAGLMHGYLDDDGQRIEPAPASLRLYRTGDLARRESDGSLTFIGRIKDVFRAEDGTLVAPAALEAALLEHPAVHEVGVVTVPATPDAPAGATTPLVAKAHVVPAAGWNAGPVTAQALLRHASGGAGMAGLSVVEFADELPRTESGKIYREALRAQLRSPLVEFTAPVGSGAAGAHD